MNVRRCSFFLAFAAAFSVGYVVSSALTAESWQEIRPSGTVVVRVRSAGKGEVLYYAQGGRIPSEKLGEFLRGMSRSAGFFSAGVAGPANCRLIVRADDNIRWKDLEHVLDYAGRNCLHDVLVACGDVILPLEYHRGPLYPFYRDGKLTPADVLVCVLWVDKTGREQAVSENGQVCFVILEGTHILPFDIYGRLISEYMPEKVTTRKTLDVNAVLGLLTGEWGWDTRIVLHVGRMVPVADVLKVLKACSGTHGGYIVLAPEIIFEEDLKDLQKQDK